MKHISTKIILLLLLSLTLTIISGCGDSLGLKRKTISEMFEEEGGVVAYKVRRHYGEDYYMIIDFNEKKASMFGGGLKIYRTDDITDITDYGFDTLDRRFHSERTDDIEILDGITIEFSRTNRRVYLYRIDLAEAQRISDTAKRGNN